MRPEPTATPSRSSTLAVLAIATGLIGPPATADAGIDIIATVTLFPVRTNTLYQDATGALAGGQSPYLFAGNTGSGLTRRGLIAFDLAGQVPPGGTLQNATLMLHCSMTNSSEVPVELHRVTADWGSGNSTPFGGGGGGASAAAGDATWLHRFLDPSQAGGGTQRWSFEGGDFDAEPLATASVGLSGSFYNWSSPELTSLVNTWSASPATNHGLLLLGDESATGTAKRFDSQLNPDESARARLVLTIFIPAPPRCTADLGEQGGVIGHDGTLDNNDFIAFIDLFFGQNADADLGQQGGIAGGDGRWDNNDFIAFIDAFFTGAGCV